MDRQVRFEAIEGELHEGFTDASASLACYTDHQIFERYQRYAVPRQYTQSQALSLSQLAELEVGDYVTHIDHGIGRFGGLQKIDVDGRLQEAVKLIYAGGDILYVSIHSFHKIAKYSGKEASQPRVDRLGSGAWKALKDRAKKRVKQVAFDPDQALCRPPRGQRICLFSGYLPAERTGGFVHLRGYSRSAQGDPGGEGRHGERPSDRTAWCAATWASARPK